MVGLSDGPFAWLLEEPRRADRREPLMKDPQSRLFNEGQSITLMGRPGRPGGSVVASG
jgi:hypothetical protein